MRIIGVDFHAGQQTIAMFATETKELVEKTLKHEGGQVREFYSALPRPVQVGIEASGSMHWFLELMEELGIDYQVGHPTEIRAAEPRKQKHDRRDAALLRKLGIRLWIMLREQIDYQEFCRRGQMRQKNGAACAGMPEGVHSPART